MDFQRSRDRRRRVINRETGSSNQNESSSTTDDLANRSHSTRSRTYSSGARKQQQLRTTDLIPKRPLAVSILIGGLVLLTGMLTVAHWKSAQWTEINGMQQLFDAAHEASLAKWLQAFFLVVAALACLQIFALRRHFSEDYRASYRLWGWLASGLVFGSLCVTTALPKFLGDVIYESSGFGFLDAGAVSWLLIKVFLLVVIFVRLIVETRVCKSASILLSASGVCLLLAVLINHSWFAGQFLGTVHTVFDVIALWASLGLVAGLTMFARFVYLDAHGLIQHKEKVESESRWSGLRVPALSVSSLKLPKISIPKPSLPLIKLPSIKLPSRTAKTADEVDVQPEPVQEQPTTGRSASKTPTKKRQTKLASQPKSEVVEALPPKKKSKKVRHNEADSHEKAVVLKLSDADQRLLDTDHSEVETLSKSDRRRLKKLQKRAKQAA